MVISQWTWDCLKKENKEDKENSYKVSGQEVPSAQSV